MKTATLVIVASALLASRAVAGDIFPSTAPGQAARDYVTAYNSGDPAMLAFSAHWQPAVDRPTRQDDLTRYHELRADLGALSPLRIVRSDAQSIEFVAGAAAGGTVTITVLTSGSPAHFAGLRVERKVIKETTDGGGAPSSP
jgi:hypothetical protein